MDTRASPDLKLVYAPIKKEMLELATFLEAEFASAEPFIWEILKHIARFGGKQIRPALLFLVSRIPGGRPGRDPVKIGAVIELIHTATLVHDDILDDARLRRNVETVHRRWGERAAVLIGDYIYSRAFHLSTEVQGMAAVLSDTTHTICEGELLQIGCRYQPDIGEAVYLEIIRKKTAILYAVACQLGGVLGGLEAARSCILRDFGLELGMAFQIVDDCLDYSGQESVAGKSLGTDLRQGKVTLPLIYLRDCAGAEDARWLREALGKPLQAAEEARVLDLVRRHGVVAEAFSRAEVFIQAAKAKLAEALDGEPEMAPLHESLDLMADYVLRRQK